MEITEGTGNAGRFGREAQFLSYYGGKLAHLLREGELQSAAVDEGRYVNAVSYDQPAPEEEALIHGIFAKQNLELPEAITDLHSHTAPHKGSKTTPADAGGDTPTA